MRLSNKYCGLQFFAMPNPTRIIVNGDIVTVEGDSPATVVHNANGNANNYTIDSDNQVVWKDGKFLAYNGVIVLGSDEIVSARSYTTIEGGFINE